MSNRCLRPSAAIAAVVCLCVSASAQGPELPLVKGEVHSDSPLNFHEYRVVLQDLNRHNEIYRADISSDGAFEFRHLPAGEYQLFVETLHGTVVQQQFVTVNPQLGQLRVLLSTERTPNSAPGTVSMTQLRHPPDRKAFQSFVAAQRFAASGSPEKAAEELEKALRISPEYADAYSNLAVQHMRMRRFAEAVDEVTHAIAIAGPNPLMLSNLAYAQINLGRIEESLATARAALRLDAEYPQAHLILGSILSADGRTRAEGIRHLELVADKFPSAREMLARVRRQPN